MDFTVEIESGTDEKNSSVRASGETFHVITDAEQKTFGVEDKALKPAIKAYFGQEPFLVFLHDSESGTPGPLPGLGDLDPQTRALLREHHVSDGGKVTIYKENNWQPVQVVLRAVSASILGFTKKPTILKTQTFRNESQKEASFDVSITSDVTDTVETNWSQTIGLSVTQSVEYGVKFLRGETSFTFSYDFQKGGSHSKSLSVGQISGIMVDLEPGESVRAELSAVEGSMRVRVEYEAYLRGVAAAFYLFGYKGQQLWPLSIDGIRAAAQLPPRFTAIEEIDVGFFSDGETVLKDMEGKHAFRVRSVLARSAS